MKWKGKWLAIVSAALVILLVAVPALPLEAQEDGAQKTNLWNWSSLTKGPLGDQSNWVAVSAGGHVMLLDASGRLWAWGNNRNGTLGDGTRLDKKEPIPIGTKSDWVNIAAGLYHSAAVDSSGRLWTWGLRHYGILGMDTGGDTWKLTPTLVDNRTDWAAVSVGTYHTVALDKSGRLWGWGQNVAGQLGDDDIGRDLFGNRVNQTTPALIGNKSNWSAVSAGSRHTVALDGGGGLWAWGWNAYGQVGDGTEERNKYEPTRIGTRNDWVSIAAGQDHTLAIDASGGLWAWGSNIRGELGDGTNVNRNTPTRVGNKSDWVTVSGGNGHTVAIDAGGSLWAWGYNEVGQLGDGTRENRNTPTRIGTRNDWVAASAGGLRTAALTRAHAGVEPLPAPPPKPLDEISINIDGQALQTDVPPIILEGRTLVPLRAIFEALGMEVEYIAATLTIIGTKGDSRIQLTVNSTQATVNGTAATLDVPAMVIDGRTLVPVRFIAESTGQNVVWDGTARRVIITTR